MRHPFSLLLMPLVLLAAATVARSDDVLLIVGKPPRDGLVVTHLDLTAAAQWCKQTIEPAGIRATTGPTGQTVPIQLVPDADYDAQRHVAGTLVLRLPADSDGRVRLRFTPAAARMEAWNGRVEMPGVSLTHDAKRQGGFPAQITFADGKVFDSLRWNDRLFHRPSGSFSPAADPQAKVTLVSRGLLCTAVRVTGRYVQANGKAPPSAPQAVYDWLYLADRPLVLVRATMQQKEPFAWPEVHFLEMDYPREAFPRWAGGEPVEQGAFTASKKSFTMPQWGAVLDGTRGIAMMQCGKAMLYDGGRGTYLQAHGDAAWRGWNETRRQCSAWLWIGSATQPVAAIRAAAAKVPNSAQVTVTTVAVREQLEKAVRDLDRLPLPPRQAAWWRTAGTEQLETQGRFAEAMQATSGQQPTGWTVLTAGNLGLILQQSLGVGVYRAVSMPARRGMPRHTQTGWKVLG